MKKLRRQKLRCLCAGIFIGLMLTITGCSTVKVFEGPAPAMKVDGRYSGIRFNSVAILDDSLQQWYVWESTLNGPVEHGKSGKIAVEKVGIRRSPTNTLEVYTVLRNRTDYPLQVQGRTQFFDNEKAPVEGPTAWQRIFLPPNAVSSYKEFSTRTDAGYYYIEIREGR